MRQAAAGSFPPRRFALHSLWVAPSPRLRVILTLLGGTLLTLLAADVLQRANRQQASEALEAATLRTADRVIERFRLYQYGLRGVRG